MRQLYDSIIAIIHVPFHGAFLRKFPSTTRARVRLQPDVYIIEVAGVVTLRAEVFVTHSAMEGSSKWLEKVVCWRGG